MQHELIESPALFVVGLAIRTSNAEAGQTIAAAWHRVHGEGLFDQIPNRRDDHTMLGVYTDYESDENGPYTFMVATPVVGTAAVPSGLERREFAARPTAKIVAQGPMPDIVQTTWQDIYRANLPRSYTVDLEIYDTRKMGPQTNLELHIALVR